MQTTSIVTVLTLALLTVPAIAGGVTASADDPPSVWVAGDKLGSQTPGAQIGSEVDIQGDTAVASAPGSNQVLVYERADVGWTQTAVLSPDTAGEGFGSSVAVHGDTIAVGAPGSSSIHVYELSADDWSRTALLTASGTRCLGEAIALDGDTILAGAPCEADAALVFEEGSEGWTHLQTIAGDGASFGWDVALDSGQAAVADRGGDVSVLSSDGGIWALEAHLSSPSGNAQKALYGWSVAIEGEHVVVGAPSARQTPAETGAAYVFHREAGSSWNHQATLTPGDATPLEPPRDVGFGSAVALDGNRLVVGAPGDDRLPGVAREPTPEIRDPLCISVPLTPTCQYPGAAYVFEATDSGWHQTAKLTAPEGRPTEPPRVLGWTGRPAHFGAAVAISSDALLAGAPLSDVRPADETGAAYAFTTVPGGDV